MEEQKTVELSEFHNNINELQKGSEENKILAAKLLLSEEANIDIILDKYNDLSNYLDSEEKEVLLRKQLLYYTELEKKITIELMKDGEDI
jgi:hypothetical protein